MTPNPFDSLYVTEVIDESVFVEVFSPLLVSDTMPLFQPGNIVLLGTQGSGKSMLLSLLKPEVQIAYKATGKPFPVKDSAPPFIGAGINLIRSGIIEWGQRAASSTQGEPGFNELETYFADFINYWIVRDILDSLMALAQGAGGALCGDLGLNIHEVALNDFGRQLARHDCWAGGIQKVAGFRDLQKALTRRIRVYRNYLNFNSDFIPRSVATTKTSAGEPISMAVELLRETSVVGPETEFFIRIDQYEELLRLHDWRGSHQPYEGFSAVIHKMLGLRDPRVSYRIGTRKYAWPDRPRMQGTTAVLEAFRNFAVIDLDVILKRSEHSTNVFSRFAEDVFRRRLVTAGLTCKGKSWITEVFGSSPDPADIARMYADRPASRLSLVGSGTEFSKEDLSRLHALALDDPLAAVITQNWIQNRGVEGALELDEKGHLPWQRKSEESWRKERIAQALLQIAAKNRQRMLWAGRADMLELSSANILTFVSLCKSIWNAWLRSAESEGHPRDLTPQIQRVRTQDEGIYEASSYWLKKISEEPDGDSRRRFVDLVGEMFRAWLASDEMMRYPGWNGFSVTVEGLASDPEVARFLEEAAGYGVLIDRIHTDRNRKGSKRRHKWYLNSAYCPIFQIPATHVKEPRYVQVSEVRRWLGQAKVVTASGTILRQQSHSDQLDLFNEAGL